MPYGLLYKYRIEANSLPQVSIFALKKRGLLQYFDIQDFGNIEVSSQKCNEYGFRPSSTQKFKFRYWVVDGDSSRRVETYVDGTFTPCRFGGKRWWFVCPQVSCQRRVGVLYVKRGVLACRRCLYLCYASQNENKRMAILFRDMKNQNKIDELYTKIKHPYYNGKPTRLKRKIDELINLPY